MGFSFFTKGEISVPVFNQQPMRKLVFTLSFVLTCTIFVQAQSKLSYSILINQSVSTNNYHQVCLNQFQILSQPGPTLPCLSMDKAWKTNITFNTNYEISDKFRLQGGLGYNAMHMDKLNGTLGTSRYQVEFLSIPLKVHYYVYRGKKIRFYVGTGVRTDIRLDGPKPYLGREPVADNSRSVSASMESLVGIEVPLTPKIMFNFEPTQSSALVRYTRDTGLNLGFPGGTGGYPYALIDQYPGRFGITAGFTFRF